jgi:hypothetical protein
MIFSFVLRRAYNAKRGLIRQSAFPADHHTSGAALGVLARAVEDLCDLPARWKSVVLARLAISLEGIAEDVASLHTENTIPLLQLWLRRLCLWVQTPEPRHALQKIDIGHVVHGDSAALSLIDAFASFFPPAFVAQMCP